MSSLVERLRVRSERKPVYSLDDSEDESDILHGKSKNPQTFEKIDRTDAVCFYERIFYFLILTTYCFYVANRP